LRITGNYDPDAVPSGSLESGVAIEINDPVNLRGSLKQLPQEGRCESTQEGSASSVYRLRTTRSGAVGAQQQRAGLVGCTSAYAARSEPGLLMYPSCTAGRADCRRFDRAMGDAVQPGRIAAVERQPGGRPPTQYGAEERPSQRCGCVSVSRRAGCPEASSERWLRTQWPMTTRRSESTSQEVNGHPA